MVNITDVLTAIQHKGLFPLTSGALILFLKTCGFSSCCIFKRYKILSQWSISSVVEITFARNPNPIQQTRTD